MLHELYGLDPSTQPPLAVEYPPNRELGDLAITVAFELAKTLRKAPRMIAQELAWANSTPGCMPSWRVRGKLHTGTLYGRYRSETAAKAGESGAVPPAARA